MKQKKVRLGKIAGLLMPKLYGNREGNLPVNSSLMWYIKNDLLLGHDI